jgi:hypothetical protein
VINRDRNNKYKYMIEVVLSHYYLSTLYMSMPGKGYVMTVS